MFVGQWGVIMAYAIGFWGSLSVRYGSKTDFGVNSPVPANWPAATSHHPVVVAKTYEQLRLRKSISLAVIVNEYEPLPIPLMNNSNIATRKEHYTLSPTLLMAIFHHFPYGILGSTAAEPRRHRNPCTSSWNTPDAMTLTSGGGSLWTRRSSTRRNFRWPRDIPQVCPHRGVLTGSVKGRGLDQGWCFAWVRSLSLWHGPSFSWFSSILVKRSSEFSGMS